MLWLRRALFDLQGRVLRTPLLWWRPRRRRVVLGVLAIAVVLGGLVAVERATSVDEVEEACGERPFTCSMATSFMSTAVVALVLSLVWVGGLSQRRALRRYRARLVAAPGDALGLVSDMGPDRAIGRRRFSRTVLDELRSRAATSRS